MISKKELQVFVFSLLKTFKRSAIIFLTYFWWLLVISITATTYPVLAQSVILQPEVTFFLITASFLTSFFSILTVRPSIGVKNLAYFFGNLKKFFGHLAISLLFILILIPTILLTVSPTLHNPVISGLTFALRDIVLLFLLPITMFFFLDSDTLFTGVPKAFVQMAKEVIRHAPMFIAIIGLFFVVKGLGLGITYLLATYTPIPISIFAILTSIVEFIGNFFFLCATSILYLKMKQACPT